MSYSYTEDSINAMTPEVYSFVEGLVKEMFDVSKNKGRVSGRTYMKRLAAWGVVRLAVGKSLAGEELASFEATMATWMNGFGTLINIPLPGTTYKKSLDAGNKMRRGLLEPAVEAALMGTALPCAATSLV